MINKINLLMFVLFLYVIGIRIIYQWEFFYRRYVAWQGDYPLLRLMKIFLLSGPVSIDVIIHKAVNLSDFKNRKRTFKILSKYNSKDYYKRADGIMKEQSFHVKSYGCQMNVYDSEKITSFLTKEGMIENNDIYSADIVIFNTCNIREKAAQKVYSDIGRVAKKNNEKVIAVVGCVAQAENSEMFNRSSDIDIILGPQSYHLLPKMIKDIKPNLKQLNTDFIINEKFDYLSEERKIKGISSFVTIQEGCDKFCAFCVVPFTRGPEYSRGIDDIKSEVSQLTKQGAKEIILLGQNVNAYHSVISENNNRLSDLIYELSEIKDLKENKVYNISSN